MDNWSTKVQIDLPYISHTLSTFTLEHNDAEKKWLHNEIVFSTKFPKVPIYEKSDIMGCANSSVPNRQSVI